jgi:UDP-N-acetylmuramate--alanine ligase
LRPLDGRRIWFVGIGGAGLSGYALLARAWGAEVGGWDRIKTPYLEQLERVPVEVSPEPVVPAGWPEVVVSTAYRDQAEGKPRAEFLAELVALQPSIVVAGAHGKTTTAAMIAYCLDRLGNDPAFLIGGDVPQLGGNARAGSGWLVVEGDESDRTIAALRPEIAVVTNVDLDHHTEFASRTEVETLFEDWLKSVPKAVRGEELEPIDIELAIAGAHNRRNASVALAVVELAGFPRQDAAKVLSEFRGAGRRLELRGEAAGVVVTDSYAHHPAELAADIAAVQNGGRVLVLFQPHLYSRTRHLARELGRALAAADVVAVTDVYRAREEPVRGVTGKLVVDAVADERPGLEVGWTPTVEEGAGFIARRARAGDRVLTLGAGDVDRAAALILGALN